MGADPARFKCDTSLNGNRFSGNLAAVFASTGGRPEGKEAGVAMRQIWRPRWRPPGKALNALAATLNEHWRMASARTVQLFWSAPVSWLDTRKVQVSVISVTTSPRVAGSSDTHPDPHRC